MNGPNYFGQVSLSQIQRTKLQALMQAGATVENVVVRVKKADGTTGTVDAWGHVVWERTDD